MRYNTGTIISMNIVHTVPCNFHTQSLPTSTVLVPKQQLSQTSKPSFHDVSLTLTFFSISQSSYRTPASASWTFPLLFPLSHSATASTHSLKPSLAGTSALASTVTSWPCSTVFSKFKFAAKTLHVEARSNQIGQVPTSHLAEHPPQRIVQVCRLVLMNHGV